MSNVSKNRRNEMATPPEPLNPGIAKAREQLARGDRDGGAATLRQLVRQPDLSLTTRIEAAKLLNSAGAQADAINVYLEIGRKALEAGDVAGARSSLSAAHALDQKNYDALFELGRADLAEGKKEEALAKFVEVLRKSNLRHLPALYEAAVLYEGDGQTDQAILAYKKIAERDRHHVPTLTRLGEMYRKKGQLGEALGYYLQAARAATQEMHFAEARNLVDAALQIEDDNWEARRLLAEINKAEGEAAPAPQKTAARPAQPQPAAPQPASRPAAQPTAARPAPTAAPAARPAQAPAAARAGTAPSPASARPAAPAAASGVTAGSMTKPVATQPVSSPQAAQKPATPAPAPAASPVRAAPSAPISNKETAPPKPMTVTEPPMKEMAPEEMDIELPAEVTLLEKQSEVTSKLAQITAEVAEAYKKRVAIERDIKAAQAALDALNKQRAEVEKNVEGIREQLDVVSEAKAAEDQALAEARTKLEASRAELEKLASLPEFIRSVEAKSSTAATLITSASATLESAQRKVTDGQANVAAVEKTASELIARIGAARQAAQEAQEQLTTVLEDAKAAKTEAAAAGTTVTELKTTLAGLQQMKTQIDAARAELKSLAPMIDAKRSQTKAALGQLDVKRAERDAQFEAVAGDVKTIASGGAPKAAPAKPASKSPAGGGLDIDALLVQGRLDDALRAAREGANGSDAASRLIEAADRLRENGNAAAAAKALEKVISTGSANTAARAGLARCYVELGRFKEAKPLFEALSAPELAVMRENGIGQCLRGLGKLDDAAQHFSKALEIPGHPEGQYREVLYNLADLYEDRGDPESLNLALWSFEEIQAGAPDYRDVAQRVASLKDQLAKIVLPEPKPALTRDSQSGRDGRF